MSTPAKTPFDRHGESRARRNRDRQLPVATGMKSRSDDPDRDRQWHVRVRSFWSRAHGLFATVELPPPQTSPGGSAGTIVLAPQVNPFGHSLPAVSRRTMRRT